MMLRLGSSEVTQFVLRTWTLPTISTKFGIRMKYWKKFRLGLIKIAMVNFSLLFSGTFSFYGSSDKHWFYTSEN